MATFTQKNANQQETAETANKQTISHTTHKAKQSPYKAKHTNVSARWNGSIQRKVARSDEKSTTGSPGHGVTKQATELQLTGKRNKTKAVEAETPLTIIGNAEGKYQVKVKIGSKYYEGWMPQSAVNKTPDSLEEIADETKTKVAVPSTLVSSEPNYKKEKQFHIHTPGIPRQLLPKLEEVIYSAAESSLGLLSANRTLNLKVDFSNLSEDIQLSEGDAQKYKGKTFAFRFTRFNNGNTQDVVLVEELGEITPATASTPAEQQVLQDKFDKYGFMFHEATAGEIENTRLLSEKVSDFGTPLTPALKQLHAQSAMAFSNSEKDQVLKAVGKMPQSAMDTIKGVRFIRQKYRIEDGKISTFMGLTYSKGDHTVRVYSATSNPQLFGDKGGSISSAFEQQAIHELGHAADHAPYREAKEPYTKAKGSFKVAEKEYTEMYDEYKGMAKGAEKNKKARELNAHHKEKYTPAKNNRDATRTKYAQARSLSGVGVEYSQGRFPDVNVETEFDRAVQQDGPRITLYSNQSDTEAFAEAFSIYVTEPQTLKTLSPNVYNYMAKKFPH